VTVQPDFERRARSFGLAAERYNRARPDYPAGLIEAIVGGDRPLDVLDVGCGTGIAARQMARAGARVLGVEIDGRMAAVARDHGTEVEISPFEEWDPAGRTFDRVTAAQVWHWVDPVAGAAHAAEVLRPGGQLCLFWNIGEPPAEMQEAFDRVYAALAPGADDYSVMLGYGADRLYQAEQDGIRACPLLSEPALSQYPWSRLYSTEEWLDQLPTHSDHAAMEPDHLAGVLDGIGAVIDGFGGSFEMRYNSLLIRAELTADGQANTPGG
jgi:SAM-dependent methyltransferase